MLQVAWVLVKVLFPILVIETMTPMDFFTVSLTGLALPKCGP